LISEGPDVTVEGEAFEIHVGDTEDGGSGRFVATAGFDTDEPVFDDVDAADTVFPGERV
jgi:hypothetical protein